MVTFINRKKSEVGENKNIYKIKENEGEKENIN